MSRSPGRPSEGNTLKSGVRRAGVADGLPIWFVAALGGLFMWFGAAFGGLSLKALLQDQPLLVVVVLAITTIVLVVVAIFMTEGNLSGALSAYGLRTATRPHSRLLQMAGYIALSIPLAGLAWVVAAKVTTPLFPPPAGLVDTRGEGYSAANPVLGWCGQLVENALSEELIYRTPVTMWVVLVVPRLVRPWVRWSSGIMVVVATSLLFGLSHSEFGMWNIAGAFTAGLIFGAAALVTRSLWPGVFAHTTYNMVVLVL